MKRRTPYIVDATNSLDARNPNFVRMLRFSFHFRGFDPQSWDMQTAE